MNSLEVVRLVVEAALVVALGWCLYQRKPLKRRKVRQMLKRIRGEDLG